MELKLLRTYHEEGTNGELFVNNKLFCYTIELPWKDNQQQVSCIMEGTYNLVKRHSVNHSHHLLLKGVEGRELILIHPANNTLKELRGCISPVKVLTAPGCGDSSRAVFEPLLKMVYQSLKKQQTVTITIAKKP
ncbi:hypothetical protein HNQ91_001499 [Filimonas zeae]|uniref:DUF5675 domain-containing protein n=1 Tax=Filimonas zeae TaxID=1737353 RepID=A0A917IYQ2_9BACT|nr:DUF5675 family protein [Filimonas zeae]MDR6338448.1 hypothetical protein [Filimonas zeae]GGH68215.1 hypothetical protein GCM10011379_24290 [Filimonas zeae]